jgi:hypothetical protein
MRGFLHYAGLVISPVLAYTVFQFCLMGLEKLLDTAIVSEGMGRTLIPLVGIGIIIWLVAVSVFGITLALMRDAVDENG